MPSSWGNSWGKAWGNSWGVLEVEVIDESKGGVPDKYKFQEELYRKIETEEEEFLLLIQLICKVCL